MKSIKNIFFHKDILNETDFINLQNRFKVSFRGQPKEEMTKNYFACLQSLIYLATHMKMPYGIEENNLSILLTELHDEMLKHGREIWVDEQEGVNIFHALARSKVDSTDLFYQAVRIFSEEISLMMRHKDKHGYTPLNTACKEGKISTVEAILSIAEDVLSDEDFQTLLNQPNRDGYTPFMSACHSLSLLKILSEKIQALDLRQKTIKDNSVLMLACHYAKHDVMKFVLEKAEQEGKETVLYLLHHQNHNHGNVLDIALTKKDYVRREIILEYAARHMDPEELIEYCLPIITGIEDNPITNMLYQAKEHCSDFKRFVYGESSVLSSNLMEYWALFPNIIKRIERYLQDSDQVPDANDTANNKKECADDLEASASVNRP